MTSASRASGVRGAGVHGLAGYRAYSAAMTGAKC
jgi:hypothetical protein